MIVCFASSSINVTIPLQFPVQEIWKLYIEQIMAVKRGDMVRAVREKLENSLEAKASDSRFPPYMFETKGEILDIKGDYALVVFGQVPTPNIWLRIDQLEPFNNS